MQLVSDFRAAACAAIVGLVCLSADVARAQAGSSDLDAIRERKVLRVAVPAVDAAPFVVTAPGGGIGGLEPDLARDIARRLDVRIEFVRTARTGAELIQQVRERQADVVLGQLPDALEWAKFARFSSPYLTLCEVLLVDRLAATRAGGIEALLARPEARIAAPEGSATATILREEIGAERLVPVPTFERALEEVRAGRAVAASTDDVAAQHWLQEHPDAGVRLQTKVRREHPLTVAMAVHWEAESLQAWLNLYLQKAVHDETLRKLTIRHLGEGRMRTAK